MGRPREALHLCIYCINFEAALVWMQICIRILQFTSIRLRISLRMGIAIILEVKILLSSVACFDISIFARYQVSVLFTIKCLKVKNRYGGSTELT